MFEITYVLYKVCVRKREYKQTNLIKNCDVIYVGARRSARPNRRGVRPVGGAETNFNLYNDCIKKLTCLKIEKKILYLLKQSSFFVVVQKVVVKIETMKWNTSLS